MKNTLTSRILLMVSVAALAMGACSAKPQEGKPSTDTPKPEMDTKTTTSDKGSAKVQVETTLGTFTVELFGDTPKHRDNFLKLAREGYYDGTLFHRVINEFMVQAGDPDSRTAKPGQQLGSGGPDYKIDAEIVYPRHFHRRGALAAARQGDQVNPQRQSSGSQFYIVTGKKVSQPELQQIEQYAAQQQLQATFQGLVAQHRDEIMKLQQAGDSQGLETLRQQLIKLTEEQCAAAPAKLTDEQRRAYTTEGGSPHLDGQYTVFGQVIDGMDVIDKIEKVQTDRSDRPLDDVRIIKMKVLSE